MAFEIPKANYTGKIKEVTLGTGPRAVTVGGESSYPFHLFEGANPHPPKIAMEVCDTPPEDWAEAVAAPFRSVMGDPVAWARQCIDQHGAELICLQLNSADPNGMNRASDEVVATAKKVADAVEVPLIVWGCENEEKDAEVLRKLAEACQDKRLILGPVVEGNYKAIGAAAIGYKHTVLATSPIDINLCKQLNILLGDLGVPDGQILVDPTTGGLGYGLEYTYSVMERDRMAALTQGDERLQFPVICNIGREVWKVKEVKTTQAEDPKLGDEARRGILMEAVTATTLLMAGADVLVLRHPESVKLIRKSIQDLMAG